ncbi:hypothetical protein N665_0909s0025 [Sinapis alba]|nr:hypothetical protein N665_0909s0025 [Sinapis alba]
MGIFPEFGAWINQNTQQPRKSENVESKKVSKMKPHEDRDDTKEQLKLWREAEKKKQWIDPSPKVKVEVVNELEWGYCHMKMEFELGLPPQAAYEMLTNPNNQSFTRIIKDHERLQNTSRKVTSKNDGKGQREDADKVLVWKFHKWSRNIPIRVRTVDPRKINVRYEIERNDMRFMEIFEGSFKVEPMYVDSKRLCKNMKPKSREEYKKCSGGQGKIASKVVVEQVFKPSFFFNLPPVSWYIRWLTVKTNKAVAKDFQIRAAVLRGR